MTLNHSKTWPVSTLAVVQLRVDPQGRTYSTLMDQEILLEGHATGNLQNSNQLNDAILDETVNDSIKNGPLRQNGVVFPLSRRHLELFTEMSSTMKVKTTIRTDTISTILDPVEFELERLDDGVAKRDVNLYLYNQSCVATYYANYSLAKMDEITASLDLSKDMFIWVHGWASISNINEDNKVGQAILRNYDINEIYVDYPFNILYWTAISDAVTIGKYLGKFVEHLRIKYNYSPSKVKCVGHSLGAHICGVAGRNVNKPIASIVGLDPAGVLYTKSNTANRLTASDANIVQVIHTNAEGAGISFDTGTADFYPNGGLIQPGCLTPDSPISCSHEAAINYYIKSIENVITGISCNSSELAMQGLCFGTSARMGGYYIDSSASGDYYLAISL